LGVVEYFSIFSFHPSHSVDCRAAGLFVELSHGKAGKTGLKRGQAAILVLLLALVGFSILGITVVPFVIDQGSQLVSKLPEWFDSGKTQLLLLDSKFQEWGWPINLDGIISQVNDRLKQEIQSIAGEALNLTINIAVFTANKLLDVVLTIVLTFTCSNMVKRFGAVS
jgi:predicted PurR-regulated permease PerM